MRLLRETFLVHTTMDVMGPAFWFECSAGVMDGVAVLPVY